MPFLVVALGNPGPKYSGTRHNIGVIALEELLDRNFASLSVHKRTNTEVAQVRLGNTPVILARTREYMNLSGGPVKALMGYFGVTPKELIVLHDELELPFADVRSSFGGGDHGHNGLKSITKSLGTREYHRVAMGIGRPPGRMDPSAFVLKPFARAEQSDLPIMAADAADEVERVMSA